MNSRRTSRLVAGLAALALASQSAAGTGEVLPDLAVEAGTRAFRVSNLAPVEIGEGVPWRISVEGTRDADIQGRLPALGPFQSTDIWPPAVRSSERAALRLCVNDPRQLIDRDPSNDCATLTLEGASLDLVLSDVRIDGRLLRFRVANPGDVSTPPIEVRVTTRAGSRLVGAETRVLNGLDPRSTREESFPLDLWASGKPDLLQELGVDCCETEVRLDPTGRLEESDETNNVRRIRHRLESTPES